MEDKARRRAALLAAALRPERRTRIVDIGANPVNPAPYDGLLDAGLVEVVGFEPQEAAYQALRDHPKPHRTVLPYAVGDGQPATLYVCRNGGFTSTLPPNPDFHRYSGRWAQPMTVVDEITIQTVKLDDIADLQPFDLLKIDIQGGECAVFDHGHRHLGAALAVYTEVATLPLYVGQPLLDQQMTRLRSHGYELHKFMFFQKVSLLNRYSKHLVNWKHANQSVDGDAVFVRNLLRSETLSTEQLKHLTLLADGVFSSHDLALRALELLQDRGAVSEPEVEQYVALLPDLKAPFHKGV